MGKNPVTVKGPDEYRLDSDDVGLGCEYAGLACTSVARTNEPLVPRTRTSYHSAMSELSPSPLRRLASGFGGTLSIA